MIRPYLVNFSAIASDQKLSIKLNITNSRTPLMYGRKNREVIHEQTPIQSINLFRKANFSTKVICFGEMNEVLQEKIFESDNFGSINASFSILVGGKKIEKLTIYENKCIDGIEFFLGSFLPLKIKDPKKILISDFDKTLVDTKYSTAKEVYYSLNKPIGFFPTIEKSVDFLKSKVAEDFQPFILSASPHFYESAIKDWLYQNKIYAGNVFLKDYRNLFSFFDGALSPKDIKKQGFYKLNQLINILLMTGVPDELILMGDGFESDPLIYLILLSLLEQETDPWLVWKSVKHTAPFKLTTRQDSSFLTSIYQLHEQVKKNKIKNIEIYIRTRESDFEAIKSKKYKNPIIAKIQNRVNYYSA